MIRGNSTSADFFLNGVRDDVQYYRDLYNLERVEALKGPNAMIFGRGGAGGVINRVSKEAGVHASAGGYLQGGSYFDKRVTIDLDQPLNDKVAFRLNGMYRELRHIPRLCRSGALRHQSDFDDLAGPGYEDHDRIRKFPRQPRLRSRHTVISGQARSTLRPRTFFGNPAYNDVRALVNIGSVAIEHQLGGWNIRNRTYNRRLRSGLSEFRAGRRYGGRTRDSLSAYNNATQRRNLFNQTDLTYTLAHGRRSATPCWAALRVGRQLTNNFRNTAYFNNTDTTVAGAAIAIQ